MGEEANYPPVVVGLAGLIGSGKSSVALGLASILECPIASFGTYVRSIAEQFGKPDSREVLQRIGENLLVSPGELTRKVLESSGWDHKKSLVVDGVRNSSVVTALRQEVAPLRFILVYLEVSEEVRRNRLAERDKLSVRDLERFDLHSTERDVPTLVRSLADIVLAADRQIKDTVDVLITAIRKP